MDKGSLVLMRRGSQDTFKSYPLDKNVIVETSRTDLCRVSVTRSATQADGSVAVVERSDYVFSTPSSRQRFTVRLD